MAIMEQHFYHKTIHLYTGVFGTVFDGIKIQRSNGKEIKVPISYAGQQKQNTRINENGEPNASRYKMRLPRLSYVLRGWQKDETRITNKMHVLQEQGVNRSTADQVNAQINRVPYNFNFELRAKAKHMDDLLQITEQILPYFNPSLQIVVEDNPDLKGSTAIDLTLNDTNLEDQFEGMFEEGRVLEAMFNFTIEGYVYGPTTPSGIIKTVHVNYYNLLDPDDILESDVFTEE